MQHSKVFITRFSVCALLIVLAGCATSPVQYANFDRSADFSAYQTFSFYPEPGTDKRGYSTLVTKYFQKAIRREMEALGYRFSNDNPDLLVNFAMSIKDKSEVQSSGPTIGYYSYRHGLYSVWPMYDRDVRTVNYKQGTANIDVIDAAREQLIWEAVAEGRLTTKAMDNAEETISTVVAQMFDRYPGNPSP